MTSGEESQPGRTLPQPIQILLVEDNPTDVLIVQESLSNLEFLEFELVCAERLHTAIELANNRPIDAVLLDLGLPDCQGIESLNRMRKHAPRLPIVVMTGIGDEDLAVEAASRGAQDYLVKGEFTGSVLSRIIRYAIERGRVEQALVTARRDAEEANRMKDEFVAVISHELRTPLTAILGWVHMLRYGHLDNNQVRRALEIVEHSARAQGKLIEDLLDVSQMITGKIRLHVRPLKVVPLIESAVEAHQPAAAIKGVFLETAIDQQDRMMAGDSDRLQQIVWNLLSNAIKFTASGGRVHVRMQFSELEVEVVVSDTGQGISPEFLPYVFDRFSQVDSSTTRSQTGLGLGLAIVRHLTELHGGTVSAYSSGIGHGATFTVRLPLAGAIAGVTGRAEHATARESFPLSGFRVLVVDNEDHTRTVVAAMLNAGGAEVRTAAGAPEALGVMTEWSPQLLLSDIGMPECDGYEFLRQVREREAQQGATHVPAIALTAYGSVQDRAKALAAGFQKHIPKPVEATELISIVAEFAATRTASADLT
jgi:signal transduction histidine kinase